MCAANSELDDARPNSLGEEEMQMQLALALSKEESEKEAEMRKGDDVLFQVVLLSRSIVKLSSK